MHNREDGAFICVGGRGRGGEEKTISKGKKNLEIKGDPQSTETCTGEMRSGDSGPP